MEPKSISIGLIIGLVIGGIAIGTYIAVDKSNNDQIPTSSAVPLTIDPFTTDSITSPEIEISSEIPTSNPVTSGSEFSTVSSVTTSQDVTEINTTTAEDEKTDEDFRFEFDPATCGFSLFSGNGDLKLESSGAVFYTKSGVIYSTEQISEHPYRRANAEYPDALAHENTLQIDPSKTRIENDLFDSKHGKFNRYSCSFNSDMTLVIKHFYTSGMLLFVQQFPEGIKHSNTYFEDAYHRELVSTAFPSFEVPNGDLNETVGFLSFGNEGWGRLYGESYGKFENDQALIHQGLQTGPFLLFDTAGNSLVVSSANHHMVHQISAPYTHDLNRTNKASHNGHASIETDLKPDLQTDSPEKRRIYMGMQGSVSEIPAGFELETLVSYSKCTRYDSVSCGLDSWGDKVLRHNNNRRKKSKTENTDIIRDYIGYWTDKGAYYYYNTVDGDGNYEKTINEIVNYFETMEIPYKYIHYDSWWYPKGSDKGQISWEANRSNSSAAISNAGGYFPNGMEKVYADHGYPISAHSRQWSYENDYQIDYNFEQGFDEFVPEGDRDHKRFSIPTDQSFWDDLFRNAKKWGLISYQQDHLNEQWEKMGNVMLDDASLADNWMKQMNSGAEKHGVNILFCMPMVKEVIATVGMEAVKYLRVSPDYHLDGSPQWIIGLTNMLADTIGLAGFKDTFYTTQYQPGGGNGNWYTFNETRPDLQIAMSILSSGQVGPGDGIGFTDKDLLMKSCDADGKILRPSNTVQPIDSLMMHRSLPKFYPDAPTGQIYNAFTDLGEFRFGILFCADNPTAFKIRPNDIKLSKHSENFDYVIFEYYPSETTARDLTSFSNEDPYRVKAHRSIHPLDGDDKLVVEWSLYHVVPKIVLRSGKTLVVDGEVAKFVHMSVGRVKGMTVLEDDVELELAGRSGEFVEIIYYEVSGNGFTESFKKQSVGCHVGSGGMVKMKLLAVLCNEHMA